MKYAVITDTHLGARNGSQVFRSLFRSYYEEVFFPYLSEHGIHTIIHCGDFFDNQTKISVLDLDYVANEFLPLLDEYNVHMHVLAGNHDVPYRNTNKICSLSVLDSSNVTVHKDKLACIGNGGAYNVYLCPWMHNDTQEDFIEQLTALGSKNTDLFGHFDVAGAKMYKHSKVSEYGMNPDVFKRFHAVYSGHFHTPSQYGNIQYLGALFHYTWEDWNDWRGFHVYDDETGNMEAVENPICLFDKFDFDDVLELIKTESKEELPSYFEGKILELQINSAHDPVKIKDVIHQIESFRPVSLNVMDSTIVETIVDDETVEESLERKEIQTYFYSSIEKNSRSNDLKVLFDDIHERAKSKMKEIV